MGVLSLNGVLRQKIRIPVPNPLASTICVDDKHAYVHLVSVGHRESAIYILEKTQPAIAGSSTA